MMNRRNLLTATVSAAVGAVVGVGGDAANDLRAATLNGERIYLGDIRDSWHANKHRAPHHEHIVCTLFFTATIEPGAWRNHPAWPRIVDSSGATPTG